MAKSELKIKARKLRTFGKSIKDIALMVGVSQSTVSLWCRDISLTDHQLRRILGGKEYLIAQGRLKGANFQRMKRVNAIKTAIQEAETLNRLAEKITRLLKLSDALSRAAGKEGMFDPSYTKNRITVK